MTRTRNFGCRSQRRFLAALSILLATRLSRAGDLGLPDASAYFPPPESQGGWRKLESPDDIRRLAGADPAKLEELKQWLLQSDERDFAAVVIRRGYIVLEVERGNSSRTDARRVASVSKAICATVLAIASEQSQQGLTPRKMKFDDPAFDFIPWARPLSDPRKEKITVKQLLNHTSGLAPESSGARNAGPWEYVFGHTGDPQTAKLAFDPGTDLGYSSHGLYHAALVCEDVTGKPYDQFAIEALFKPIGVEKWSFDHFDGGGKIGRHANHDVGLPARELAKIAYCMLHGGRWQDRQVIPAWFVEETAAPTHPVKGIKSFGRDADSWSHGWELPARLSDGRGAGIPLDARFKPGSGGQLIAFVPGLDLVITRQTGSSGQWGYEEYLRRACAAVAAEEVEAPPRTTLSDPGMRFSRADKPYAVLKRGPLEAVVVDNRAVDDEVLPGHRAGYHGIGSLKHVKQPRNLFVPTYAGLNLEHIHDGTAQPQEILFEPRRAPVELRLIDDHTAELYQPPTPHWGLESCLRYELLEGGAIELTFECIPRRESYKNGYIGLFWASYIDQPESLDIHFIARPDDGTGAIGWIRGATPQHGELSTHLALHDDRDFAHDANFPLTLVFNRSKHRHAEPWYFGECRGMAFAPIFRPADRVRFSQSPSGGGAGNPAWDFQWVIPKYEVGRRYQLVMRALYMPAGDAAADSLKAREQVREAVNWFRSFQ